MASLNSEPDNTSLNSQFQKFLISVIFVAIANLSNIFATCARVIVWYGMNDSVVLYEVIHMSYIQFIASINSGVSVSVSFHAIISRLTELQVIVLQLAAVIQFESGLLVSIVGS
jgi:hypothetical protein